MLTLGFWSALPRPFFALAPMANVTDSAFRQMFVRYGKPDVLWTEFVSVDGLCSKEGRAALAPDLYFTPSERPIVLQIFGAKPDNFYKVGILARELGFDGVDINMGCPDDAVCRQGAGIALIKTPDLAQKIIRETKRGAGDLPVSVKTRIGYNKIEYEPWILSLLSAEPAVLTIHARTKKDMSKVPARWEIIGGVVQLVRQSGNGALVIGNGDVVSLEDAKEKARVYGVDGVMIGRGVFGNPWFFNPDKDKAAITLEEKLGALTEHLRLFESLFSEKKNFAIMKKHFSAYIAGYPSVKKLKIALMGTHNGSSAEKVISDWLSRKSIWQWFKRVFSSF